MASERLGRFVLGTEDGFCNLDDADIVARRPAMTDALEATLVDLPVANVTFVDEATLEENGEMSNKHARRRPFLVGRAGGFNGDLYPRGLGTNDPATDPQLKLLRSGFGVSRTAGWTDAGDGDATVYEYQVTGDDPGSVVGDGDGSWDSATQLTLDTKQVTTGLEAGMGFSVIIDGLPHISYITDITGQVITHAPGIPEWGDAGSVNIRGGVTLAIGQEFADDSQVFARMLRPTHYTDLFGAHLSEWALNLESGSQAKSSFQLRAPYSAPNNTNADALAATATPDGEWISVLACSFYVDGARIDTRKVDVTYSFDARNEMTAWNHAGSTGMEQGAESGMKGTMVLSRWEGATYEALLDGELAFSLNLVLGTSGNGQCMGLYAPAAHVSARPSPDAAEDTLIVTQVEWEADSDYSDDQHAYDPSDADHPLSNTTERVFFGL